MAAIIITGSGVVYFVAHRAATVAYDRALMDVSLALASQVETIDNKLQLQLPAIAEKVLLVDGYDKLFYEVIDPNGKTVAGNTELPRPATPFEDGQLYYNGKLNGKAVRIAALSSKHNGTSFIVLAAETELKRDWLAGEIVLAMLVPEGLLIIAAIFMIRRSIRHGLASIQPLREELVRRTHADLKKFIRYLQRSTNCWRASPNLLMPTGVLSQMRHTSCARPSRRYKPKPKWRYVLPSLASPSRTLLPERAGLRIWRINS